VTGPEHYRKAEQLLAMVEDLPHGEAAGPELIAEAQVHATLALAAATAMQPSNYGTGRRELVEWQDACWPTPSDGPCRCDHHGDHAGCDTNCECTR
jgi:hypothetical protein